MNVIFADNPFQYLYILRITYLDDQLPASLLYVVSAKDSPPLQPWLRDAYFMFQGNKASIFSSVSASAMCCNT
jgi:hypothetical protein